jgi:hypothetical protein
MEYQKIDRMSDVEVAYFAGLLDGEGCVRVGKFRNKNGALRYRAYMVIAMTDARPINWLVSTVGGKLYIDKKARSGNSKICFCWTVNAREGAAILRRAMPLLLVKSEQATNFLAFVNTLAGPGGKGMPKNIPSNVLAARRRMYLVSTRLNRKGRVA